MSLPARRTVAGTLLALGTVAATAGLAAAATGSPATPPPFTSGTVAALAPSSMEVQNPQSGQTTVSWTATTDFSRTVTVGRDVLAPGACVTVNGTSAKKVLTAQTISIGAAATGGKCEVGRTASSGPTPGFRFSGNGRPPPSGFRGRPGARGGAFPRRASDVGFASGKVTSVSADQLVVSGFSSIGSKPPAARQPHGAKKKSSRTRVRPKTTTVRVRLGSSTAVEETQPAAAIDLAIGDCVTATGSSDSTGAIVATSVHIATSGPNGCTGGFLFQGGGAGGPGTVTAGG